MILKSPPKQTPPTQGVRNQQPSSGKVSSSSRSATGSWLLAIAAASCTLFGSLSAQSPFLEYSFDESGGSSVADSVGNNNGQLTGSATHPQAILERGISFAGTSNAYVTTANSIAVNNSTGLTVNVWVRPTSYNSNEFTMIAQQLDGNGIGRTWLSIDPNGNLNSWVGGGGTNGSSLTMNEWQMVTVTAGSGQVRLYVNGVQVGSSNRNVEANTAAFRFGNFKNVSISRQLRGALDELGIYSGVLTANQVNALYQSYLAPGGLTDEQIIAQGLVSWNKPDGDGISCAECHTPFGYDVAMFDFDQADLRRATAPHLTDDDADDIFAMIEVLREWYPPQGGLKDVETFRPMQPGGGVILGGVNASLEDRDDAFGEYLMANFKVAQSPVIDTLAKANAALQELVDLDLRDLPVGIKMNKWSEAVSRSGIDEGGRIAEWIPGIGLQPKSQHEAAWNALVDAYIADPTDANFWAYFHKIDDYLEFDPVNSGTLGQKADRWLRMTVDIFKSNNVLAHNELNKAIGAPELIFTDRVNGPFPDQAALVGHDMAFIWDVGDTARELDGGGHDFTDMPLRHQDTLFNADGQFAYRARITDLRTKWFWLGFTLDPTMWNSGAKTSTLIQEYMMNWGIRNHRSHYAFANVMVMANRGMLAGSWNPPGRWSDLANADQHMSLVGKTNFLAYERYKNHAWGQGTPANQAYRNLIANGYRAVLLRSTADIIAQGRHWSNQQQLLDNVEHLREAMNWADPGNQTLNNQIVDAFITAVQTHPK